MSVADVLSGRAGHALLEGDCRALLGELPDKSVDVVATDPPYSEHVHGSVMRGADGWKGEIAVERALGFAALDDGTRALVAREIARLARRWALVFSDTESAHLWREALEGARLEYVRTCFWRKKNGAPQFTGDRPAVACEAITVCHAPARDGHMRWNGGGKQGFYDVPIVVQRNPDDVEKRVHPTQKPEALMRALVEDFSDEGDLILDPFAGSGTTGAAALALGRRFVGIERDPQHAATARARLAGLPYKPAKAVEPPQQPDLFTRVVGGSR